jgi:2-(1,2-epoxy-1,2-dihydrophenyl)acetyl-CoA isomerase
MASGRRLESNRMAQPTDILRRELAGGVLTLTLNRPEALNALTSELRAELRDAVTAARRDTAVRSVVITGAGRAFCAGADLRAGDAEQAFRARLTGEYNPLIRAIRELDKPIIAAVNGVAAGAGVSLALACDVVLASETARFVPAFYRIGLVPDSGLARTLVRGLGRHRALKILVGEEGLSATEARELGIVAEVVPPEQLSGAAARWAQRLAVGPAVAFGYTKRLVNAAEDDDLARSLEREAGLQELAGRSEDHAEGVAAFAEKREPRFGR